MMRLWIKIIVILISISLLVVGTYYLIDRSNSKIIVRIATTTSLYTTGLLEYMANTFRKLYPNVEIVFIAVGSGAALEYAKRGDVCMVIVHAPELEAEYLKLGVIDRHKPFVYNFFVIIGPSSDPANVSRSKSFVDAFQRIYIATQKGLTKFVSRADRSGTCMRERYLWRISNVSRLEGEWYIECGCGADQALLLADELEAYTFADVGTYEILKRKNRLSNIVILYTNTSDYASLNIYSTYIATNCRGIEKRYTELFQEFLYINQNIVEEFCTLFGTKIFTPVKDQEDMVLNIWRTQALGKIDDQ
ncbi:MAG: substrate-binding domain-containing protein [Ignisphaera sp.]